MFRCRTPNTRSRSTIFSRPPRRRRTWRASTAFVTAIGPRIQGFARSLWPHARRRFRPGSEAPDHSRHLCFEFGLLRCLLSARAKSSGTDPAGFRAASLQQSGRVDFAHFAGAGIQIRARELRIRCRCIWQTFSPVAANLAGICAISLRRVVSHRATMALSSSGWAAIA